MSADDREKKFTQATKSPLAWLTRLQKHQQTTKTTTISTI